MQKRHFHQSFKDPWRESNTWAKGGIDRLEDAFDAGEHIRFDQGLLSEQRRQEAANNARNTKEAGKRAFEKGDQTIDAEGKKEKAELIQELQEFQRATGIDQSDTIKKAEACRSKGALERLESALHRSALDHISKEKLGKHPVFKKTPGLEGLDEPTIKANKEHYMNWAKGLPLRGKGKEDTLAHFIANFDTFIKPRIEFKEKLSKQSLFIQKIFYQELNKKKARDPATSEVSVLNEVLEEMEDVLEAPEVVQIEFKALENSNKTPGERAALVLNTFNKKMATYEDLLKANMSLFGGKEMVTPQGRVRAAAHEFYEWMTKRESFAEMDDKTRAFQEEVIPKRRAVYERRDELLNHLPENSRQILLTKTNEMRFHTLKIYIKDLEKIAQNSSLEVMEYIADVESSEYGQIPLFNSEEKKDQKSIILAELPEHQKSELDRLHRVELPKRTDLHKQYLELPNHLRNDKEFAKSNIYDKKRFIAEALKSKAEEAVNPFAVAENKKITKNKRKQQLVNAFRSKEGQRTLQEELNQTAEADALRNISTVTNRVGHVWEKMESEGKNQVEHRFEENIKYGLQGRPEDLYKVGFGMREAQDDQEQLYGNQFVTDLEWMISGYNRKSGGAVEELQLVDHNSWMRGDDSIVEALDNSSYDDMAMFLGTDGKDELKLTAKNKKAFMALFQILSNILKRNFGLEDADAEVVDAMESSILGVDAEFADAAAFNGLDAATNSDFSNFEEESEAA